MPKGNHSKKTETALGLVQGAPLTDKAQLAKFQSRTAEQLALIQTTEHGNVVRRLFVGLALHSIKASMKHGEWLPWLKKNAKGNSYRQTAYMMSAALAFVEEARVAKPELLAITSGETSLDLDTKNGATRKIAAAAEKFVGELTWGELLDKHGIKDAKKLGGARTPGASDKAGTVPDEEQLYLFARDEIGGVITRAEELLVKENRLQFLARNPDEVRGVVTSLRALADRVEKAAEPLLKKS